MKRRPCLMAYTLDGKQPVICTIVADQPYFYAEGNEVIHAIGHDDSEEFYEDDDWSGDDYHEINRDLEDLQNKIDQYERLGKTLEKPKCELSFAEDHLDWYTLQGLLRKSNLLNAHMRPELVLILNKHVFATELHRAKAEIHVHSNLGMAEAFCLIAREVRRDHRPDIHYLDFHPDHAILYRRICQADELCFMLRVAWEMKLSGWADAWNFLVFGECREMFRSFHREAALDFRTLANGKAMAAAFEAWFLGLWMRHTDKRTIQAMLADHRGSFFETADRHLTVGDIVAATRMAGGTSYLAKHAPMILEDPVFTEVRDQSNHNFLWFIKFERSFRATPFMEQL